MHKVLFLFDQINESKSCLALIMTPNALYNVSILALVLSATAFKLFRVLMPPVIQ
jgi:hypothetical protein